MVSATESGATTVYSQNGLGQRVRKTTAGISTYFVYDEAGHLIGEYDNSGNLIQETIWFGDMPVAVLKPNGSDVDLFYIHMDHLGTPRKISRPSDNAIVWRWDSDPFGTTAANEDPDGDAQTFVYNLRFAGQYFDAETGLHYNHFRDYDPATGRYVQSDPIGLRGGLNTYLYANANPLSYLDSFGLLPVCDTIQVDLTRHRWTETTHKNYFQIPAIHMYPSLGVGPQTSLSPPRRPPIKPAVRYEIWFVYLQFRRDIHTTYEQFIQHMVNFCKDKITDECGREKEITLEPSYFDIKHDPIKLNVTETDIYLFTEMVRRLGES